MVGTSIRTYLLALVLAVFVPLGALVGYAIYQDLQQAVAHTKTSLRTLVSTIAGNTGGKLASVRSTLERLAQRPRVLRLDPAHCDPVLQDLRALYPDYANVVVTDARGNTVCSALAQPAGQTVSVGDMPWFARFLAAGSFTVGAPHRGPISGKWVSVVSTPVWGEDGKLAGGVHLALELAAFDPQLATEFLPTGSRYGFFQNDGVLVWRNLDPEGVIGSRPDADAARHIAQRREGEFESLAVDGVTRFFSVVPMPEVGWVAFVGVPADTIHAQARDRAVNAIVAALAALAVVSGLALVLARRISAPVLALQQSAQAVHAGDLHARAPLGGPREVAAVAQAFNAMLASHQHDDERLRVFLENSAVIAWLKDEAGRYVFVSDNFIGRLGLERQRVLGRTDHDLCAPDIAQVLRDNDQAVLQRGGSLEVVERATRPDGSQSWWLSNKFVFTGSDGQRLVGGLGVDITERKLAEDEVRSLAFFDPLTRLPNRRLLMDRLRQALVASARSARKAALLYVDLDNFKTVNDTQGHEAGDGLLRQVANRLIACVREGDTVARLGGDEFVLLLVGLSESTIEAASQVESVGQKMLAVLNAPYTLAGLVVHSTPSIGAMVMDDPLIAPDELMKQADLAMYEAKACGRNTLRFFDPEMQRVVAARAQLELELREGLRLGQFELFYQPQVGSRGQVLGAEALLRWWHPHQGLVLPGKFIGLAEATGLILPLGRWVLQAACAQLARWAQQSECVHLCLAVNVSARQFRQSGFVDEVLGALHHSGAQAQRLKLELTESLMVDDVPDVIDKMKALKAQGVGFALDDFGTGYSSLHYLKRMPLDQLKIDQSFVRDVLTDANDAAIARTIIALGQSLGLAVIAEGVESDAQRDYLARHGCVAYQGFYFGRPLPLAQFEATLAQG